jgi:hypothetical protein
VLVESVAENILLHSGNFYESFLHLCGENVMLRFLVTAIVVLSSPILVTMMMPAIRSSETSVLTRTKWRNIPVDGILQNMFLNYINKNVNLFKQ